MDIDQLQQDGAQEAHPQTAAGRALLSELGLAGKPNERLLREQIRAIEAEITEQALAQQGEAIRSGYEQGLRETAGPAPLDADLLAHAMEATGWEFDGMDPVADAAAIIAEYVRLAAGDKGSDR